MSPFAMCKARARGKALGRALGSLLVFLSLAACVGSPSTPATSTAPAVNPSALPPTSSQPSPLPPNTATAVPASTPTMPLPTAAPSALWLAPYLPAALHDAISLPDGWAWAETPEAATARLEINPQAPGVRWVYALVAPFPTVTDEISIAELQAAWGGTPPAVFPAPLRMDAETLGVLTGLWGAPADGAVLVLPADQLVQSAWDARPSWAIVPFEALEPRWKVLEVEGQSPLHKDFDPAGYALSVPFGLSAPAPVTWPASNRRADRLTTVITTGVTALVRATAFEMERKGVLYPAQDVGALLREADITHISNEVPFDPACPYPDPRQPELVFCSAPKYIDLLKDVGTDVVELTGDHFIDPGPDATLFTIDLYHQLGWAYYGGGTNLQEGLSPAKFTHNGNKIAFVGCNAKGGGYATASENYPGAAACGYDVLHEEIGRLKAEGYLVIATFQHQEQYTFRVNPALRPDFTAMVDAGATIVQGSQAHQPQNLEFYGDGFIHYGLGNLFFDQYMEKSIDGDRVAYRAFIDRHVFYDGRYLGTELITILFVDNARPRLMTPEERSDFLGLMFTESGW